MGVELNLENVSKCIPMAAAVIIAELDRNWTVAVKSFSQEVQCLVFIKRTHRGIIETAL